MNAAPLRIPLERLTGCFQGVIPSWLFSCSADGTPNAAILSHVDYVDSRHVALSFQFFNKSKRNITENPQATVRIIDAETMQVYMLGLRFVRTECSGPLFESMRLRIEAIASHSGLKGIFQLLGADVYEVLSVDALPYEAGHPVVPPHASTERATFTMAAMQEFSDGIHQAHSLDCLLDNILERLERIFGFGHAMILLMSDQPDRLELVASRGYSQGGVGSDVGFGEGIIGMVAEARRAVRISGMLRSMLYADAVARRSVAMGLPLDSRRIPLPGLESPHSQLGIPLLVRDELIGVLCIESTVPYRFHEEDRAYLEMLGGFLALAIQNAVLRERAEPVGETADLLVGATAASAPVHGADPPLSPAVTPSATQPRVRPITVEYYENEECVLVDGEYLVRSLPARILWKLLSEHHRDGVTEFTNRRLRLDRSLMLPEYKDNLETRLILLRRRLAERCPEIRMVPAGRGRFRLELGAALDLLRRP
jgi:adenylate cyclase